MIRKVGEFKLLRTDQGDSTAFGPEPVLYTTAHGRSGHRAVLWILATPPVAESTPFVMNCAQPTGGTARTTLHDPIMGGAWAERMDLLAGRPAGATQW